MTIEELKRKLKRDMKKHRTLEKASKEEDFKLAHSMIADYLEELIEEIGGTNE